jgi:hypothetical protein
MSYVFRTIIAFPNPRYSVSAPRFREGNKTERFAGVPRDRQPRERFFLGNVSGDVSVASAEASIRTGASPPRRKTAGLAFSSRTRSSRSSIRIRSTGTLGNVQLAGAVMYGTSHNDSKGVSIIDAASGKFLRVAK